MRNWGDASILTSDSDSAAKNILNSYDVVSKLFSAVSKCPISKNVGVADQF